MLLSLLLFTSIKIQIYILPIVALGIGLSGSMFSIGINSQLPHLIVEKKLVAVNSWISSLSATATIFGALTAGLIIAMSGYKTIFVINIITYLLAALAILPLKSIISQNNTIMKSISTRDEYNLLKSHLKQNKVIASILLVSMADTLGSAAHNVAFPVFSKLITPQTASQTMGLIIALWAVGDFIGSLLSGRLLKNRSLFRMERLFTFGVGLMSTGFILLFFQEQMSLILACAVFAGIGDGILQVSLSSRIQYEPEAVRLSIFSLLTFFQMTGFALGMIIAAPFFNWWLPSYVVLLFHGLALVLLFISWFMNHSIKPVTLNE